MPTSDKQLAEDHPYKSVLETVWSERNARTALNDRWLKLWSLYKTEPLAISTDEGWQSKLNDGRVFEIVETVASYIRDALFFSDNWLTLEATEPNLGDVLPLVSAHFRACLGKSNLKREFRVFLRQLLLLGFSGMTVEVVDGKLSFTSLNAYDTYIESTRRYDRNSFVFRDVWLNYSAFEDYLDAGLLELPEDERSEQEFWDKHKQEFDSDNAGWRLNNEVGSVMSDTIRLVEYWCPIEQKLFRFVGDECVGEEEQKYCPWFIMTLYELPDSAYGMSLTDSSIGLILENNCIMNRRLDNMAVSVDNMWLFVDDGVTNPDDIKTAPGKVIPVARPDVLTPLYPPSNNFQVTYQEASVIDQKIDRNTGTGALISSGTYRSGERVTATEVNSVKDAGGNRLTDVYEHVENTLVLPLLEYALELLKTTIKPSTVKVASERPGVYDYFRVLPEDFSHTYTIALSASQSVINRDRNIRRLQEFLALVSGVPQFAELVDYNNLYDDLLRKFGFDNPERYKVQKQEKPEPTPASPMDAMSQEAQAVGGAPMANAITSMAAAGSLPQALASYTQGSPSTDTLDPAAEAQVATALNQPLPQA